jgi:prepilin-type N-terminal cleavage/methylation domain-containing protein
MSRRRSKVSNQKGFTLIEIIAVLVILGILAAVAIPRFMDLTSVASDKAAMQAVAEGKSRLSNQFARALLSGTATSVDALITYVNTTDPTLRNAGDYTLTYAKVTDTRINVRADGVGSVRGTNSSYWIKPQ